MKNKDTVGVITNAFHILQQNAISQYLDTEKQCQNKEIVNFVNHFGRNYVFGTIYSTLVLLH